MYLKYIIFALILGSILGLAFIFIATDKITQYHSPAHAQLITSEKPKGGDFTLTSDQGERSLNEFLGKIILIYFGYTFCPDICPTNLSNISIAYHDLTQAEKDNLQILFISVDPERDTLARLQQYSDYFEANIIGLTGEPYYIAQVAKQYGVVYARVDDPNNGINYAVDHSAFTYIVDSTGQLQTQLPHATMPDEFIKVIRQYQTN